MFDRKAIRRGQPEKEGSNEGKQGYCSQRRARQDWAGLPTKKCLSNPASPALKKGRKGELGTKIVARGKLDLSGGSGKLPSGSERKQEKKNCARERKRKSRKERNVKGIRDG